MLRKTIVFVVIFMLMCFAMADLALMQLALNNATSNDNVDSTSYCTTNWGGPCSPDRPTEITQDESVTGDWKKNEPYACSYI